MPKTFLKENNQLIVSETKSVETRETYSYDLILNKIQELSDKLVFWQDLKKEADKLNLKR